MTPKQIERLQTKIKKIRASLASEKRRIGCYDDSRGLRYVPLELYIKLEDYKGGLVYTRWFDKNFPEDMGFPIFLFEWLIILFKNDRIKEAEKKAIQVFLSNSYIFDAYFERESKKIDKYEFSNWETKELADKIGYSKNQENLHDFTEWLLGFEKTERFENLKIKYFEITQKLRKQTNEEEWRDLLVQLNELEER